MGNATNTRKAKAVADAMRAAVPKPMRGKIAAPPDIQAAKLLSRPYLEKLIAAYTAMPRGELEECMDSPKLPALHAMIASIIHKAIYMGDTQRLDFLLNRTIGKVADKIEVSMPEPTLIKRLSGETVELGMLPPRVEDDEA